MRRGKPCRRGHDDWAPKGPGVRCRPCYNESQRRRRGRKPHINLHNNANRRAREGGYPFTLTLEDVRKLLESGWACIYCESPVGSFTGGVRRQSATLDRLVPAIGYTVPNTVLACHACNASKGEHTPASLRAWADKIESIINRQNPHTRPDV